MLITSKWNPAKAQSNITSEPRFVPRTPSIFHSRPFLWHLNCCTTSHTNRDPHILSLHESCVCCLRLWTNRACQALFNEINRLIFGCSQSALPYHRRTLDPLVVLPMMDWMWEAASNNFFVDQMGLKHIHVQYSRTTTKSIQWPIALMAVTTNVSCVPTNYLPLHCKNSLSVMQKCSFQKKEKWQHFQKKMYKEPIIWAYNKFQHAWLSFSDVGIGPVGLRKF